jgi:hypothetical protein
MPRTKTESERPTVRELRDQAEKVRTEAALNPDPRIRAKMLKTAKTFDNAADMLDGLIARERPRGPK